MTLQQFTDHAQLFGVRDAALAMRNDDWELGETLFLCRYALCGYRVQYRRSEDGFDWLAVKQ